MKFWKNQVIMIVRTGRDTRQVFTRHEPILILRLAATLDTAASREKTACTAYSEQFVSAKDELGKVFAFHAVTA